MSASGPSLLWLRDPHLAPHAVSPLPAWLWSIDATRVLWANATGAAIFGAATPAALCARKFDRGQPAAAQIAHLAETLAPDAPARLERLRGFGAGIGRALTCTCTRVTLPDGTAGILAAATERAGPDLSLEERVTRLFSGVDEPVAAFAVDGTLLDATPSARTHLGHATSLAALGADAVAAEARATGHAAGNATAGLIAIDRIGGEAALVLVATFGLPVEELAGSVRAPGMSAGSAEAAVAASPSPEPPAGQPPPGGQNAPAADTGTLPEPTPLPQAPAPETPRTERRHPLRFVWQMDADGRFTVGPDEFIELLGPITAAALGRPWPHIASALGLDPEDQIARAIASRDTWSGLAVQWPVDASAERLTAELSGLPVFDRERAFRGYRGFGVCRDIARLNALAQLRAGAAKPAMVADNAGVPTEAAGAENVSPLQLPPAETGAPTLSPLERHAFHELSRRLSDRIVGADTANPVDGGIDRHDVADAAVDPRSTHNARARYGDDDAADDEEAIRHDARPLLDRLPLGILVYRLNHLLYANSAFLQWTGYENLDALAEAGGLDSLLVEPGAVAFEEGGRNAFTVAGTRSENAPADARLFQVPWQGESAFALVTVPRADNAVAPTNAELDRARAEIGELHSILDTATDGVIVVDGNAHILSLNRCAQALFGYEATELAGRPFIELFAPESVDAARDYLDGLQRSGVASVLNDGREIIGRERRGGLIPLFMTMGRIGDSADKFCAVFRDITPWKKAEEELIAAKRQAERASSAKSDFLARISHEIRTPLNAIIGFSEVMMEERFGPVGNDRYRQYLKDIHTSGGHLLSLINDLLDLSKIEAGKLELAFANVSVNDLVQQCVAIMQPQANRERIIIRTSLSPKLPQIVADARSIRQIALNLLSNSIKFTGAGGQVIVSTARTDAGEVVLRVRDTGIGMSEKDIATAMEPFRQLATSTRFGSGGTGLGLPLTKALAEANRASFTIKSAPNAGTLVEVTFPATQVLVG